MFFHTTGVFPVKWSTNWDSIAPCEKDQADVLQGSLRLADKTSWRGLEFKRFSRRSCAILCLLSWSLGNVHPAMASGSSKQRKTVARLQPRLVVAKPPASPARGAFRWSRQPHTAKLNALYTGIKSGFFPVINIKPVMQLKRVLKTKRVMDINLV